MRYPKMTLRLGLLGCLMLAWGCVKSVTGQYYNFQADQHYYQDRKDQAFDLYLQAARNGVADSQYQVAQMLLYCDGVPGSTAEGIRWLKKAADQQHAEAARDLGLYFLNGEFGCSRDTKAGVRLLEQSAGGGDSLSMFMLGYLYVSGYGGSRDTATAAYWFTQAAAHGESVPEDWQDANYLAASKAPSPFDAGVESRARIKRAQTGLKALGYYKSAIDGIAGPGTAKAVKQFQADQHVAVTGQIDAALMRHLYRRIVFDPMNIQM